MSNGENVYDILDIESVTHPSLQTNNVTRLTQERRERLRLFDILSGLVCRSRLQMLLRKPETETSGAGSSIVIAVPDDDDDDDDIVIVQLIKAKCFPVL